MINLKKILPILILNSIIVPVFVFAQLPPPVDPRTKPILTPDPSIPIDGPSDKESVPGWRIYTYPKYGYKIKFPDSWSRTENPRYDFTTIFSLPSPGGPIVTTLVLDELHQRDFIRTNRPENFNEYKNNKIITDEGVSGLQFGGIAAAGGALDPLEGKYFFATYFEINGRFYAAHYTYPSMQYIAEYNTMVKSMSFYCNPAPCIKSSPTPNAAKIANPTQTNTPTPTVTLKITPASSPVPSGFMSRVTSWWHKIGNFLNKLLPFGRSADPIPSLTPNVSEPPVIDNIPAGIDASFETAREKAVAMCGSGVELLGVLTGRPDGEAHYAFTRGTCASGFDVVEVSFDSNTGIFGEAKIHHLGGDSRKPIAPIYWKVPGSEGLKIALANGGQDYLDQNEAKLAAMQLYREHTKGLLVWDVTFSSKGCRFMIRVDANNKNIVYKNDSCSEKSWAPYPEDELYKDITSFCNADRCYSCSQPVKAKLQRVMAQVGYVDSYWPVNSSDISTYCKVSGIP